MRNSPIERGRPQSPNIQIYRPQLTSVLSIANRISSIALSIAAVGLVAWLVAAAQGPQVYSAAQTALASLAGRILLFGVTFAFFLHLCGGIRHLIWDSGYGFALQTIYASGWTVVVASLVSTLASWIAALFMTR